MGVLTEFLRGQQDRLSKQSVERQAIVAEWVAAVERLLEQIRSWVKAADPSGVLRLTENTHEIKEPGLGRYTVPILALGLDDEVSVIVMPEARKTILTVPAQGGGVRRADGRVDLIGPPANVTLVRVSAGAQDEWYLHNSLQPPKPFDQAAFERIVVEMLK